MLSNQVLNKIIRDIKDITGATCSIWNIEGKCLGGDLSDTDTARGVQEFLSDIAQADVRFLEKRTFFRVSLEDMPRYVLAIAECPYDVEVVGKLVVSQLENLQQAYKEHLDKNRFIQNLLLDNLLIADIYNQARKLRVDTEQARVVFLIEPKSGDDTIAMEMLKGLFGSGSGDFVTAVTEGNMILVKSLDRKDCAPELDRIADAIVDTLAAEAMVKVRVAYGTVVTELKDVSKSYKEADMALDVGRIFYQEKSVLAYSELGIGRLIYQLPVSLCEMFLKEVFEGQALEHFDEETLAAVNKFFENNLNISETARQLYLHRNTLVYRLEKIQKTTGLDVRTFDDALTFKIAMMVSRHLKFLKEKE